MGRKYGGDCGSGLVLATLFCDALPHVVCEGGVDNGGLIVEVVVYKANSGTRVDLEGYRYFDPSDSRVGWRWASHGDRAR